MDKRQKCPTTDNVWNIIFISLFLLQITTPQQNRKFLYTNINYMASAFLSYLEEHKADMISYGRNTGNRMQWAAKLDKIIKQFQAKCGAYKGKISKYVVQLLRSQLKRFRNIWAKTGYCENGKKFAAWLGKSIELCRELVQVVEQEEKVNRKRSRTRDKQKLKKISDQKKQQVGGRDSDESDSDGDDNEDDDEQDDSEDDGDDEDDEDDEK